MLFKRLTCVGIRQEREAGESVQYLFLVILLGCVVLRLRILRYPSMRMSFFVGGKGCVNFYETTPLHENASLCAVVT
jgi:hypothetical protein